eukprot:1152158-Pelagomonas_calceolata.AAC.1
MRYPPPWPISAPASSTQGHSCVSACLYTPRSSLDSTNCSSINCLYIRLQGQLSEMVWRVA